jgi:hypothetical protein
MLRTAHKTYTNQSARLEYRSPRDLPHLLTIPGTPSLPAHGAHVEDRRRNVVTSLTIPHQTRGAQLEPKPNRRNSKLRTPIDGVTPRAKRTHELDVVPQKDVKEFLLAHPAVEAQNPSPPQLARLETQPLTRPFHPLVCLMDPQPGTTNHQPPATTKAVTEPTGTPPRSTSHLISSLRISANQANMQFLYPEQGAPLSVVYFSLCSYIPRNSRTWRRDYAGKI